MIAIDCDETTQEQLQKYSYTINKLRPLEEIINLYNFERLIKVKRSTVQSR